MVRRELTKAFELEALKRVMERGVSVAQAARDLELAAGMLRRWILE